ncbi:hypothetical protein AB205_0134110 [Aquarana catesbeiana]|uniref:Reverse transcriptase domain-containing protein n=1 Tax=Aquarana catesbeiana TaxID=8400 RepID=A0A2G9SJY1_AQUCT|nr:hypothetical protein AB205_0134110 [Aquarana catesbeiana]
MESPITEEEVLGVIKDLRKGSAPGPDGLSIPYYKSFGHILAPHLTSFFNSKTNIMRGTRQGCPLSPLIFAIVIETLAIAVRHNTDIKGVICGDQTHKCGLFADDILLFLTSPLTTLPNLCLMLEKFAKISGLEVNFSKSQALNVSLPPQTISSIKQSFKFKWSDTSICYLGITLTAKTETLYTHNYPPLFKKLEADLVQWSKHELSWLGRINSIKMTLLPRLLYFFRSLPIPIKKENLSEVKSTERKQQTEITLGALDWKCTL